MSKQVLIVVALVLAFVAQAFAVHAGKANVTGVVIMQAGEEVLVDLDAASGLAVGDLLEVVQDGEDIVHPTTGAVLGRLEQVVATLQVTRMAAGYSYTRVVGEAGAIARGDRVRLQPAAAEPRAQPAPRPAPPAPRSAAPEVRLGPSLQGVAVGLAVADVDGQGALEAAVLFAHRLDIVRLQDDRFVNVTTVDLGVAQRAIAIDAADLDGDGRAELYITAVDEGELRSLVVVCAEDGSCRTVYRNLPWFLRAVHLPGEGRVLLGQKLGGQEEAFRGAPFRVQLSDGKPVEGPAVAVPPGTALYGFAAFADADGRTLFARLTPADNLRVTDVSGEVLWESTETFGGSETSFDRVDPHAPRDRKPNDLLVLLQTRLEIGPDGELILPMHDGRRLFKRSQTFDKGRIVGLQWNGHTMVEQWRTPDQKAYLADFRLADFAGSGRPQLVVAQVFLREGFARKGRSGLALVELP
jgi:hypothetical protein